MRGLTAPTGFADDDGAVDPALARVLAAATGGVDEVAVVEVLRGVRVLVPVVAVPGQDGADTWTPAGSRSDKNADMALVLLTAPDGRKTLPVFSGIQTLTRWNPRARPVPVLTRVAALAGVDEGCELMVLDPAGPAAVLIRRPALWAIARDESWTPSHADPQVVAAIESAVGRLPGITGVATEAGTRSELAVVLTLVPGLTRDQVTRLTGLVSQTLARLDVVAERVDSVQVRLR